MKKKRIVVTGMGVVSCFGADVETFYNSLLAGKSGIGPITAFDTTEYPTKFAGQVAPFDTEKYIDKKQNRRIDPFIRYGLVAGKKALEMAQIKKDSVDGKRVGVIIGSGMGGMQMFQDGVKTLQEKGHKRITPFFVPFIITNMVSALLSMDMKFQGPNFSVSTACATSNNSIISAAKHIQDGEADIMVCGGTEAPILPIGLAGFVACRALSESNDNPQAASRPWDTGRNGFVIGEGAGVLILEEYEHAKKRGAPILAEYLGGFANADAHHITEPRPDGSGVKDCIEGALHNANCDKERVNYINAHATSTPVGDLCEVKGIKAVFGGHIGNITMNATKSMTGHSLGAAGGFEAIATIKAIQIGKIHPTINIDNLEEEVRGFDIPQNEPRDKQVDVAISNSFGFGGHNATLVFGAIDA